MINMCTGLQGKYSFTVTNSGNVTSSGWFDNMILNNGLDLFGEDSNSPGNTSMYLMNYCFVGTDNSATIPTQTTIGNFAGSVGCYSIAPANSPIITPITGVYSTELIYKYQFAQGQVVGNITEFGVGPRPTNADLFSRALITDSNGNPTVLSLTALDELTVYYKLTISLPFTPTNVIGTFILDGVTYNTTGQIDRNYSGQYAYGEIWGSLVSSGLFPQVQNGVMILPSTTTYPHTGASLPYNMDGAYTSYIIKPYIVGSYKQDVEYIWGINQGNIGGFKGLSITTSYNRYNIVFDKEIPKDNTKELKITLTYSWGRV